MLLAEEQIRRRQIEELCSYYENNGLIIEAYRKDIREAALAEFTKQLDAKIKNMQDGEYLSILFEIDIIRSNGKVRGGSGSQRNMPEYIEWRSAVYERDNYTCRECGKTGKLNAHHIKSWQHHPSLRFDVDNGVTLCPDCHANKHPHLRFING